MWRNRAELEVAVLSRLDAVVAGKNSEDDDFECKRQFPNPETFAKQLAGMSNRAQGRDVVLIVGADEKAAQVVNADAEEIADWYPKLAKMFEQKLSPELDDHFSVSYGPNIHVTVMRFRTDRAPYLVRDDRNNYNVWWRVGTSTRSATREQLLRMLVPRTALPNVQVLTAQLSAPRADPTRPELMTRAAVSMYIDSTHPSPIYIPIHRIQAWWTLGQRPDRWPLEWTPLTSMTAAASTWGVSQEQNGIRIFSSQVVTLAFRGKFDRDLKDPFRTEECKLHIDLSINDSAPAVSSVIALPSWNIEDLRMDSRLGAGLRRSHN